jgi:FMN reductase
VRAQGARTATIIGQQLDAPQLDFTAELTGPSARLIEAVRQADGVILASPSYHGGISGLLKNAIDHLELLREDDRPYLRDLPVGLIATGDGWQGPNSTLASMRQIVHALQGWPTPLGVAHNVTDGGGIEPVRHHLELMASQVVRFARTFGAAATAGR